MQVGPIKPRGSEQPIGGPRKFFLLRELAGKVDSLFWKSVKSFVSPGRRSVLFAECRGRSDLITFIHSLPSFSPKTLDHHSVKVLIPI